MHKLFFSSLIAVAVLSACGGGGSDSPDTPATTAPVTGITPTPAPTPTPTPTPEPTAPVLVDAPAEATGTYFTIRSLSQRASEGRAVINFVGETNLLIVGHLNSYWVSAASPGGTVSIDGTKNLIVFRESATPTTVSVVGADNTFYLPEGSPIVLSGSGVAKSTVKYYKP